MTMFVNFLAAAVLTGTPILYGTVGEIITEKAGNLNLGVEGMMAIGAVFGFYAGFYTNSVVLAMLCAFAAGVGAALIYTVLTVTFKANQNVTGLTLTIFGIGFANFLGDFLRVRSGLQVLKLSDAFSDKLTAVHIPVLSDIPVIGKLFFQYNPLVYLAIVIAVLAGIYLKHTRAGLNVRAVGENPAAADAAGINITAVKYFNLMLGGGICGLGGAYISLALCGGVWTTNCVNGIGWIAVALVIFASWNPFLAVFGSLVFGGFSVLKFYVPKSVINIPEALFDMLPFLVTALVLIITSMRNKKENAQPAGCGINYFREER